MDTDVGEQRPIITQTTYVYESGEAMWRHLLMTLEGSDSLWLKSLGFAFRILGYLPRVFEFIVPDIEIAGTNLRVLLFTVFLGWIFMQFARTGMRMMWRLIKLWCLFILGMTVLTFVAALFGAGNVQIAVNTGGPGYTAPVPVADEPLVIGN